MIKNSISELVGKTPLVRLNKFESSAEILCKLEYFNPAGSIKDRAALNMINDAENKGLLRKGSVIIEPTSGNTGIGLAAIGVSRGYRVILTMPDTMSIERRRLLSAYGAEIVLTDGKLGMNGAVEKANELCSQYENAFLSGQFYNPSNPDAHYKTTGREIWEQTGGIIDFLVCGVGTGGTLTGTARYLKEKNPEIRIVAIEPEGSPLISRGVSGTHGIQGIGANFIPENFDLSLCDEVVAVSDEDACAFARELARREGYLTGISSGAALCGAMKLASRPENKGKTIVAILPDGGERYLSTGIYD